MRHTPNITPQRLTQRLRTLHLTTKRHNHNLTRPSMTRTSIRRYTRPIHSHQRQLRRTIHLLSHRLRRITSTITLMRSLRHLTIMTFTITSVTQRVSIERGVRLSLSRTITLTNLTTTTTSIRTRTTKNMTTHTQFKRLNRRLTRQHRRANMNHQIQTQHTTSQTLISISRLIRRIRTLSNTMQNQPLTNTIRFNYSRTMRHIISRNQLTQTQSPNRTSRTPNQRRRISILRIITTNTRRLRHPPRINLTTLLQRLSPTSPQRMLTNSQLKHNRSIHRQTLHSSTTTISTNTKTSISRIINRPSNILIIFSRSRNITRITRPHRHTRRTFIITLIRTSQQLIRRMRRTSGTNTSLQNRPSTLHLTTKRQVNLTFRIRVIRPSINRRARPLTSLLSSLHYSLSTPTKRNRNLRRNRHTISQRQHRHISQLVNRRSITYRTVRSHTTTIKTKPQTSRSQRLLTRNQQVNLTVTAFRIQSSTLRTLLTNSTNPNKTNMTRHSLLTTTTVRRHLLSALQRITPKYISIRTMILHRHHSRLRMMQVTTIPTTSHTNHRQRLKISSSTFKIRRLNSTRSITNLTNTSQQIRQRRTQFRLKRQMITSQTHRLKQRRRQHYNHIIRINSRYSTITRTRHNLRKLNRTLFRINLQLRTISRNLSHILNTRTRLQRHISIIRRTISTSTSRTLTLRLLRSLRILTLTLTRRQHRRRRPPLQIRHRHHISRLTSNLDLRQFNILKTTQLTSTNVRRTRMIMSLNSHTSHQTQIIQNQLLLSQSHQQRTLSIIRIQFLRRQRRLPNMNQRQLSMTTLTLNMSNIRNRQKLTKSQRPNSRSRPITQRIRISILRIINTHTTSTSHIRNIQTNRKGPRI